MKKIIISIFILFLGFNVSLNVSAVSAESAIIYDPITQTVIYSKNANQRMSMASTTKIMTAVIANDYLELYGNVEIEITAEMAAVEGSSMGLVEGDVVLLSELIVGMLLPSGNDAATAIAIFISGSEENFAMIMNEKARMLGMSNSSFVTASGLDATEHYSTAYDMAKLMAYALTLDYVSEVMASETRKVSYYSALQEGTVTVELSNHNRLLYSYEYTTGGKTGYTSKSGRCLVSSAEKNSYPLIAVTLNAPDDWDDHIYMYNMAYETMLVQSFEEQKLSIPFVSGGHKEIIIEAQNIDTVSKIEQKIFLPRFIYDDYYKTGEVIGYVKYYQGNELIKIQEIIY